MTEADPRCAEEEVNEEFFSAAILIALIIICQLTFSAIFLIYRTEGASFFIFLMICVYTLSGYFCNYRIVSLFFIILVAVFVYTLNIELTFSLIVFIIIFAFLNFCISKAGERMLQHI